MNLLLICLALILGVLTSCNYFCAALIVILILFLVFKKKYKLIIVVLVVFAIGFLISFFSYTGKITSFSDTYGIVIKESDNFVVLLTFKGSYYLKVKDNQFLTFDILKISGDTSKLSFNHFESGFDFKKYLSYYNVNYQLNATSVERVFTFFPLQHKYEDFVLHFVTGESRTLVSSFLFKNDISSLSNYSLLSDLDMMTIVSASGIGLRFLQETCKNLLYKFKLSTKVIDIILIFITLFIYVQTRFKISFLRFLIVQIYFTVIKYYKGKYSLTLNKYRLTSLELNSIIAITLILIRPKVIFEISFYLTFLIVLYNNMMGLYFKKVNYRYQNILRNILICLLILPVSVNNVDGISIFRFLLSVPLLSLSKLIYVCVFPLYFLNVLGVIINPILSVYLKLLSMLSTYSIIIPLGRMSALISVIYVLIFFIFSYFLTYGFKRIYIPLIMMLPLIISFNSIPSFINKNEVHFIDVGQGDATLIRVGRKNVLVDTGGSTYNDLAKECLIPYFRKLGIYKLDAVLITHRDYDHYGALNSLLNNFKVNKVYFSEDWNHLKFGKLELTNYNHIPVIETDDTNDLSAVIKFQIKNTKFLIMGDSSYKVEKALMSNKFELDVDILKVGHHGSNTSTSFEFLEYTSPSVAVISVGENNRYKHPASSVIQLLESLKIKIRRTDVERTIVMKV